MAKIHLHDDQFDGHAYPWCGHNGEAVTSKKFEATKPELRCKICEREWFPHGQPDWHYQASVKQLAEIEQEEAAT